MNSSQVVVVVIAVLLLVGASYLYETTSSGSTNKYLNPRRIVFALMGGMIAYAAVYTFIKYDDPYKRAF
uniref:Uncharacterized protein n=1 Tax=viral metagenome TaxID=1070528 RepID=A0A6C0LYS3_9ZZZZ